MFIKIVENNMKITIIISIKNTKQGKIKKGEEVNYIFQRERIQQIMRRK